MAKRRSTRRSKPKKGKKRSPGICRNCRREMRRTVPAAGNPLKAVALVHIAVAVQLLHEPDSLLGWPS